MSPSQSSQLVYMTETRIYFLSIEQVSFLGFQIIQGSMCRGVQRETEEEWTGPYILYDIYAEELEVSLEMPPSCSRRF